MLFDARGAGSSDRDELDFSIEARVRDLEGVVDRLGLESFVLVGRFHGGAPAVAYAVRHPDKVTHLVLWDAYVRGRTTTPQRLIHGPYERLLERWKKTGSSSH